MKFKFLLISTLLLSLTTRVFAIADADSTGVENQNGKKIILHKIDPKDNYYSLGRRYGVSPKAIIQYNNNVSLQIGHVVKVPTERPFTETAAVPAQVTPKPQASVPKPAAASIPPVKADEQKNAQAVANSNSGGITVQQYKVSQGETLYSIARRFGTTVEDITTINKLTGSIQPGQVLQVRTGVPPAPVVNHPTDSIVAKRDSTAYSTADSLAERRSGANRFGLYEKNEKGVATWIDDASLDPNKKLILHRTAPIGTVMKITNPMTNRSTFAKVVGRFTDNQDTKDVVVIMTKNVAESLGALDKRFHVNISYGALLNKPPYVIGIAGSSGSGKTFFLKCFLKHFSNDEVCLVSQDDYYIPVAHNMTKEENKLYNFDLPQTIDHEHFEDDISKLMNNQTITKNEYTFNNPNAIPKILQIKPAPVIIVEGLFILHFRKIAEDLNMKIFIEANEDIALQRRLKRDLAERGYSNEDAYYKWVNHAVPAYKEYLLPYKGECDRVITNNTHKADDMIAVTEEISKDLRKKVLS